MQKQFKLASKPKFKKELYILGFFIILFLMMVLIRKYSFLDILPDGIFILLILFGFTVPILYILIAMRNFKHIGDVTINPDFIEINMKDQHEKINTSDLVKIDFNLNGIYGDSISYWPGGLIGAYSKDGSGNILTLDTIEKRYKLNIVLESFQDLTALKYLLSEIKNKNP